MISKSPNRHTFQKESYIKSCQEKGTDINPDILDMYDAIKLQDETKWDEPQQKVDNLEYDLLTTEWILEKVRNSESYAQNLYAAMCNTEFVKNEVWPLLNDDRWSVSWRGAGGIIADMRQEGDYVDWYCSGIGADNDKDFVVEGHVTQEVRTDLLKLGWIVIEEDK